MSQGSCKRECRQAQREVQPKAAFELELCVNRLQYADESFGAVGSNDVAIGLDLRPLAVEMSDVDDASVGMRLAQQTHRLTRDGVGKTMAEQNGVKALGCLHCLYCLFLRVDIDDVVSGGLQGGAAQLQQFRIETDRKNFHLRFPGKICKRRSRRITDEWRRVSFHSAILPSTARIPKEIPQNPLLFAIYSLHKNV